MQFLSDCQLGLDEKVKEICIYTDGSASKGGESSAFAFAVFGWCPLEAKEQHRFLGWFASPMILLEEHGNFTGAIAHSAEEAEAAALIWALIWMIQSGLCMDCHFCFDSLNIGYGASGRWNVRPGWVQGEKLRELTQLVETLRKGLVTDFIHVKAHSGQPCNEVVDALAYFYAHRPHQQVDFDLPSWQPIFNHTCNVLSWSWWFVRSQYDHSLPPIQENFQSWRYHDWRGSDGVFNLERPKPEREDGDVHFRLQVATYNVMTLKTRKGQQEDFAGLGAAQFLRRQLNDEGYHLVGLQETRANQKCTFQADDYFRFISGNLQGTGHRGVELWVSRSLPFTSGETSGQKFIANDVTILHAEDDLLTATVNCAGHLLVVFVCHAPYEGAGEDRKNAWWTTFDSLLSRHRRKGRVILLGDFNARMGCSVEDVVGDRVSNVSNDNGERFITTLQEHAIWLPSTYSKTHKTEDETWTHPRGHQARLDYVGIDLLAPWSVQWSGVDHCVQTTHKAMDHCLVGLVLQWSEEKCHARPARVQYDWEEMATPEGQLHLQQMLQNIPALPWSCEVHHQWDYLDGCVHEGLAKLFPPKRRTTRSDIFSTATWRWREEKMKYKENLKQFDEVYNATWLKGALRAWRYGAPLTAARSVDTFAHVALNLMRLTLLQRFKISSQKLREQVEQDKTAFINGVVDKAAHSSSTDVFKALRILRVGSRLRKMKQPPLPQLQQEEEEMADDYMARDLIWQSHCAKLEAGVQTTTHRLLQRIRKGSFGRAAQFPHRELQEAPTLLALERSFRRIKRAKAPGHDGLRSDLCSLAPVQMASIYFPILAKMVFQINEPIQSKGGVMIAAYKGGKHDQIDNYRGLLLSSHTGKALRRTIRQQLQDHYARAAPPLHISIKTGGSVSQASHVLRAFHSIAKQRGQSVGTLYLDVKSAYYRVVRQLAATLSNSDEDICRVLQYFELSPEHLDDLLHELRQQSECSVSDVPPQLECLLAELLSGTWFMTESKQGLCESLAGSRPGDGLADIVFGFIFKRVLAKVVEQASGILDWQPVETVGDYNLADTPPQGLSCPPFIEVVWADDLAFSALHEDAESLIQIMTTCTTLIFKQVLSHGMIPNLKEGKTELQLSLRGKGSRAARQRLFNTTHPTLSLPEAPKDFQEVRLTASYRHLGTQVHLSEQLMKEIKARMGQAAMAYRTHRRQVFQNARLPLSRRIFLFQTMVLSILQYNMGTWYGLTNTEHKYLRSKLYGMYRGLCRAQIPDPELRLWNDAKVLSYLALPDVQTLLHGARLRYSLSLGRSAPSDLWHILALEQKWLAALRDSQEWFMQQVRGFGPAKDGSEVRFDLNHSIRSGGKHLGRWIKKAGEHAILQKGA